MRFDKKTGLYLPPKASGYSEAGASRRRKAIKDFNPRSSSPNEDINWNNCTLRQRGRMLYMSAPVATSAINTNRAKVVGSGLTLKSAIDREILGLSPEAARDWQRRAEREFRLWAERKANCDASGMNSFEEIQQLVLTSWLMSGDVFALLKRRKPSKFNPYSLRLQIVEADRVSTPYDYGGGKSFTGITDGVNRENGNRIYDGVEVNGSGMAVAYHIRNTYPGQITGEIPEWTRVEIYGKKTGLPNALHVMSSERPDQYRGVTYLAQSIEMILQLRRYTETSLMSALVQSFFTAWIVSKSGAGETLFGGSGADAIEGAEDEDMEWPQERARDIRECNIEGPASVFMVPEGDDVKFGSPNIPMAGFDAFVKTFCEMIGAGLGLPYDVLMKEYNSSYSAARGALMDAWDDFRMRRRWLVSDFCQPVYEVWLAEAAARGRISAPGFFDDPLIRAAWCGARWIGPVQSQLDPLKEAKAAVLQIQSALKTHEQVARELGGGDWEENAEQLARENSLLAAAGAAGFGSATDDILTEKDGEDEEDE